MRVNTQSKLVFWILAVLLCLSLEPLSSAAAKSWMLYRNTRWRFCVDVPRNWEKSEGVDHAGILIYPSPQSRREELSSIEVGGRINQPSEKRKGRMQTLDEVFTNHPDVLREVQNLELVKKTSVMIQDNQGIYAQMKYQINKESWVAESITFITPKGVVYLLEMRCRRNQFEAFDQIFRSMAFHSFKLNCR
jgi:hypothetical protein